MANSRQSVTIFSPSSKRPTKRTRSSITEHSFQGITPSPRGGSVTHVSGTNCHPCVRPLTDESWRTAPVAQLDRVRLRRKPEGRESESPPAPHFYRPSFLKDFRTPPVDSPTSSATP